MTRKNEKTSGARGPSSHIGAGTDGCDGMVVREVELTTTDGKVHKVSVSGYHFAGKCRAVKGATGWDYFHINETIDGEDVPVAEDPEEMMPTDEDILAELELGADVEEEG